MAGERYFEYYVMFNPTTKRNSDGDDITPPSSVVVDVKRILAKSEREVGMIAAREVPQDYVDKLDKLTVTIRPF